MSDMLKWAESEIDIACRRERAGSDDADGWDYGVACYESALKAFKSLLDDGHSGFSIGITKNILVRLIEGMPLTPIEDTPFVWNDITRNYSGSTREYQCKRMSSLFKTVYSDGSVKYSDIERVFCTNVNNPNVSFTTKIARDVIDSMDPITMPYTPKSNKYEVFMEDFLTDSKNGDYDTQAVLYAIDPDGKKIEINRYFAEINGRFVEITKEKYFERKARAV